MDSGYSYIPDNSIEVDNESALEFEDKTKAVMMRVLVLALSFYFGFKIMK